MAYGAGRVGLLKAVVPSKLTTLQWPHTQNYMNSTNWS